MLISNLYLMVAGQVALVLVFLIAYLIYMLVSEENRWEVYSDKLKAKIRELLDYKERFDVVSGHLHQQMELTEELTQKLGTFESLLNEKDSKIAEHEVFISELQKTISDLQAIINELEEKEKLLDESTLTITELKAQLVLLEEKNIELPEQINGLNITIERLETENTALKGEINLANERLAGYKKSTHNVLDDNFNLDLKGVKSTTHNDFSLTDTIHSRYQKEVDRLRKNYNNQKNIIDDLESALMKAKNNPDTPVDFDMQHFVKLQQMLSESNTVVEMLEGEIDTLQAEIDQLMMQNSALSDRQADTTQSTPDKVANSHDKGISDDVFFADTPSNDNQTLLDIEPPSESISFTHDNLPENSPEPTHLKEYSSADHAELEQLQMQLESANQMAMNMMMTSGDQGNIINFARNSIQYETLEELGKGILETVTLFQVHGALQLRGEEHEPINLSSYGVLTAQDSDKISDTDKSERFTEDGAELLIKFKALSLLIKDMPLNDPDKMGRIKDNMAIALELACANLNSIEASITIKKNQKILNQVLKNTYETIQNVEKQFNEQNDITNQVINSLTGIISNPAMTQGMDPIYKDVFTSIIEDGKKQFDLIKETGVAIDSDFADIVKRLGSKINE